MKTQAKVVVIGGGVVGCSVLYHLTKFGWTDVMLIERSVLTAGSTWHAAAGFHAINGDPNIAALQKYTIELYKEIAEESGHPTGVKLTGGVQVAATEARWEFLRAAWALNQVLGVESRLVTPDEVKAMVPLMEVSDLKGGLFDPVEGYLEADGTTQAYAKAARKRGAEIVLNTRVTALNPRRDGGWDVVTEQGTVVAEYVVNAAGLWADRVGLMAGVRLPVAALEHHYLVTETMPEIEALDQEMISAVDLDGFTYSRQEGKGMLLGIYEQNTKHWNTNGVPWDFGMELIPEDIERIAPELEVGFRRFPALAHTGIKRWVNGAFTFTPDGNPLVGPVPGLRNFWCACGVMAGFSQGGGVGLALAEWMIHGEMTRNIIGMDVARYFPEASSRPYLMQKTAEFYARRFMLNYPNEVWPAARPLKTTPVYEQQKAKGALFGASYGVEYPLWFAGSAEQATETPTFRHSNAHPHVAQEVKAVREAAGFCEAATFSKYEITGPGAPAFVDRLLACRLPAVGRARVAPMLGRHGQLMGDLTVFRLAEDRFMILGSGGMQTWHMRWFEAQMPESGVMIRNLSADLLGFVMAGPKSREVLAQISNGADVSDSAFRFMDVKTMDIGMAPAIVGRLSVTGELGYEIYVQAMYQRGLYEALTKAGEAVGGVREFGVRAMDSLRLEKSFGVWGSDYSPDYTPHMSGLDRFVAYDKADFIGRDAALRDRDTTPAQRLVTLAIDSQDAHAWGYEPVWHQGRKVGYTTSGGHGHHVGLSLALAYVDSDVAQNGADLSVHIVGEERPARILKAPAHDPQGARMRG